MNTIRLAFKYGIVCVFDKNDVPKGMEIKSVYPFADKDNKPGLSAQELRDGHLVIPVQSMENFPSQSLKCDWAEIGPKNVKSKLKQETATPSGGK